MSCKANRFEKTCRELEEKIQRKNTLISGYQAEIDRLVSEADTSGNLGVELLQENARLEQNCTHMQKAYEESKAAWDCENAALRVDLGLIENDTVKKKVDLANVASELDGMKILYAQAKAELKQYTVRVDTTRSLPV